MKECGENIEHFEKEIRDLVAAIEAVRDMINKFDKEINQSGASVANLRDNLRLRKLVREIAVTQQEIDSHDMEEAAKAKRTFEAQYKVKKAQESELQSKVCGHRGASGHMFLTRLIFLQYAHTAGELSSDRSQLRTWENDLKESFKDINKKYTDQLIKVKVLMFRRPRLCWSLIYLSQMSDMANSDLEKYAKALDKLIL